MSIDKRLRERRAALGLTQKELAKKVNVSEQLISLWELDRRSPSATKLAELSDALGITTDFLIKGMESELVCDIELAIRSSDLSSEARDALLKVANLLKEK
ncbi:MAG: helix-turn-helix transcriptional regulator [Actinobacteria bacterium]|nr:helix-turn-helix transcriptional regulator [Actinomycetota bacterium]